MADFQFRTRGQQIPQGKQRVYFTCHPDDFEKFFEEIQKEILDRQDCAVFYLEPNTQPEDVEDYKLRLREMQLFVVPVTTKLLTKANRAMDVEVPFAFENHIPVLPLMQERGLDDVFNKKFGDLQYLDKHNADPTAIPYEEKLTKYLESVIVGDELAKKVRAAFDAYIFLSYRKKDRKYAQELMKLIHSNPLCRDIAIWYDEFLTPGENFNDAIRDALEKSELFALAVTPNLINEINYILTTEYPMARDMGKKILPAEMEATDRDKLGELYADLPELIDNGNTAALAARLSVLLEAVAIRKNDADPQHNFFIGLAYLGGIDVEVDHKKALDLITSASNKNYIPAVKKLAYMYYNGEGVKRNYRKTIECQERILNCYEKSLRKSPSTILANDVLDCLEDLITTLQEFGLLSSAKKYCEVYLQYCSQFIKKYKDIQFKYSLFFGYNLLGNLYKDEGEYVEAERNYQKGFLLIYKKLNPSKIKRILNRIIGIHTNVDSYDYARNLALSYLNIGEIISYQGKYSDADEWYNGVRILREAIAKDLDSTESQQDLSIIYTLIADNARFQGKYDIAEMWIRKALSIEKRIAEQTKDDEAYRQLFVCYERLGNIFYEMNNYSTAEEYYRKGFVYSNSLVDKTDTIQARRDLSVTFDKLGDVAMAQGNLKSSEKWHQKSLDICETLTKEVPTRESQRDLAVSYDRMGDIHEAQNKLTDAEEYYHKCKSILEELINDSIPESQYDLALCYRKLGTINHIQGSFEKSIDYLNKGITIVEPLIKNTESIKFKRELSILYNSLGEIYEDKEMLTEAEELHKKSLTINESLANQTGSVTNRSDLSYSYHKLGDTAKKQGKKEDAEEWYRKSFKIRKAIAEETNTVNSFDDLSVSYYAIGLLTNDESMLKKSLSILMQLVAQVPDNPRYAQNVDIVKSNIQKLFEKQ